MTARFSLLVALAAFACGLAGPVGAEETPQARLTAPFGYADADRNGVNDLFRDADGNGMDDVTGRVYLHLYPYCDKDQDGRNDYYQDADGDGKNDLYRPGKRIGDYFLMLTLDADDDGHNDVTGKRIPGYKLAKPFRKAADSIAESRDETSQEVQAGQEQAPRQCLPPPRPADSGQK